MEAGRRIQSQTRSDDALMGVFLTAEWRDLAVPTYRIDPSVLQTYLPRGLRLDSVASESARQPGRISLPAYARPGLSGAVLGQFPGSESTILRLPRHAARAAPGSRLYKEFVPLLSSGSDRARPV